ncbi:MAG: site-specific DNA-methyltransferase [Parachlamydia sp.]|nr:site-specific DNA-methyltransferase [Parachlamydia sp.]
MKPKNEVNLVWPGKDVWEAPAPHVLCEKEFYSSPKWGLNDNLLIYGDNLLALKALERDFTGQVKCIYIDPPYNTKNKLEHYGDSFGHGAWLDMMKERLVILRRLLKEDGTIWISIDDEECHYLKVLCDEIFGRQNFVANVIWEKKYSSQNDAKWLSISHDHILVYAKNKVLKKSDKDSKKGLKLLPRTAEMNARYKNPDKDQRGPWMADNLTVGMSKEQCPNQYYAITDPDSGCQFWPNTRRVWSYIPTSMNKLIQAGQIIFRKHPSGRPLLKRFLPKDPAGVAARTIWKHEEIEDSSEDEIPRRINLLPRTEEMDDRYRNLDKDLRGPWKPGDLSVKTYSSACDYQIKTPSGRIVEPPPGRCWRVSTKKFDELCRDNRIWFGPEGKNVPRIKRFLSEVQDGSVARTLWSYKDCGSTAEARKESLALNSTDVFSTPKPERLIQRILYLATNGGDLVLDCFAGSGTTGAVAHKMGRRWIMVELGKHCQTHIIPRLQMVLDGTDQGKVSKDLSWQGGGGFHYYELVHEASDVSDKEPLLDELQG